MIRLPQRSVTRFFIPLIDVLTLLFAIFLLLPLVKPSGGAEEDLLEREKRLRDDERRLEQRKAAGELTKKDRDDLEQLRKDRGKALKDRLAVRVLEIDGKDGTLFYRDPERVPIASQADALALIERDRRERGVKQRELYYLILYPRERKSPYPTRGQREEYDRWFEGVALGYDVPGKGPEER
jgi:hypothetical protein